MPINLGYVSKSGTITVGGTAQVAAPAQQRASLFIQNIDAAEDLWVSFTGTAAVSGTGSFKLVAGASILYDGAGFVPTNPISVVAATLGHKYTIYEG